MPARVYTDKDANLRVLKNKTLAVIGFGSQGRAHAENLRDSGLKVLIGLYEGSRSIAAAREEGFEVLPTAEAVHRADVILMALPDTKQPACYETEIGPNLTRGKTLVFCHGFAIHYRTIVPPQGVNVIMVAPKGPGPILRRQFTAGKGIPSLIAIDQNPGRDAKQIALAWAKGIGSTRAGVIETTFREETETDLFSEQAVLCGGCTALVQAGYESLVEAGYSPETAYFECLYELKQVVELMQESGIAGMRAAISETAKWGDVTVGPKIIDGSVKRRMRGALKDIRSGKFARRWIREYEGGYKTYKALLKKGAKHPIEKTGARLRAMMRGTKK
jgi:ketol-acid reductoisomerase